MTGHVLIVEDDAAVRDGLVQTLMLADLEPKACSSFVMAKDMIAADWPGVILSDIRMPGRDGFHLLDYAQDADPDLPVILLTGEGDIPMAVRAMEQGAFGFLEKPCASQDLLAVLGRALRTRSLVLENRALKAELAQGDPLAQMLVGSPADDASGSHVSDLGLAEQMARAEKLLLSKALERAEGRAAQAAEALKLPRKTFYDKLAKHDLRAEDFRK